MTLPRVLAVAGSDSSGGAGVEADIKAIMAMGGYAATAITAITVQDSCAVREVFPIPARIVAASMRAVLEDVGADAVKTGMLVDTETIAAVHEVLRGWPGIPLILDPVMVSTSGRALLADDAVDRLKTLLLPRAALITPNLPEASRLLGRPAAGEEAARALLDLGPKAVLLKGGHGEGDEVVDILAAGQGIVRVKYPRLEMSSTHGTGCTLASAIAARLAAGDDLRAAYETARRYLQAAIATAPGFGAGRGPVNHLAGLQSPFA